MRQFQRGDCFQETAVPQCCWEVVFNVISCLFQIKHKPIMKLGTKYPIVLNITTDILSSLSFYALTAFVSPFIFSRHPFKTQTVEKNVLVCVFFGVQGGWKEGALKSQWLWGAVRTDSALSLANGGAKLGRAEHCAKQRMMVPLSTGAWLTEMERRGKCSASYLTTWIEQAREILKLTQKIQNMVTGKRDYKIMWIY